MTSVLTIM